MVRGLFNGTNTNDLERHGRSLLLFETFLSAIPREISHVLSTLCLHVNQKTHVTCNFNRCNFFSKIKDFSRSQPVTYTVNVVISRRRTAARQTTNRKWYMTYGIEATLMTLSDLQGHPLTARLFNWYFAAADETSTNILWSVTTELFVKILAT